MYCAIVNGEQIVESVRKKSFQDGIAQFVEVECPRDARFLVLVIPSELILLVINLDRTRFARSAEHVIFSEIKEMHCPVDGEARDSFKKLYINEEGFVRAQMGKDGPLLPFSAPFNNYRQDPGSANILINYLDLCWPEVKSKVKESLAPLSLHLLVHEVSRSSSLFLLSSSNTIPRQ